MDLTYEALAILVFLIPGFLSSYILNIVVVRKSLEGLQQIIEALIFSFVIYVLVALLYGEFPASLVSQQVGDAVNHKLQFVPRVLGATFSISVLIPLLLGYLATHDLHMRALRGLRVTHKSARASTWLDVFIEQNRFVIVNLSDGRRVAGWPMYYSDDAGEGLIYLRDPAWVVDKKGKSTYIELDVHGLFLVKKEMIESIEFTNTTLGNVKIKDGGSQQ